MTEIYLGLGSNVGEKVENLKSAIGLLSSRSCPATQVSSVYRTEPVGFLEQDKFLNCVVRAKTALEPHALLRLLQSIEDQFLRVRTIPNGPRTLDLDLLFYGDRVIREAGLIVPHPRLHERDFVLVPLAEIAPSLTHPLLGKTARELLSRRPPPSGVEVYMSGSDLMQAI